jgi:hypothetical protein
MNPIQTTGKVAIGFMDAMKSNPLVLALIVISFSLVGLLYLQSIQFTNQRRENVALFIKVQSDVQQLLAQCIVPAPAQR